MDIDRRKELLPDDVTLTASEANNVCRHVVGPESLAGRASTTRRSIASSPTSWVTIDAMCTMAAAIDEPEAVLFDWTP
jgi:hypothetical protein